MSSLTNHSDFGLVMAVWLAHDDYSNGKEEFPGENVISATALLKPIRRIILEPRLDPSDNIPDVADMISSRFGHAIHDSVEHAWKHGYDRALKRLGYPPGMIKKIKINPDTVEDGDVPVYLEQRGYREIKVQGTKVIISGKFDQVVNGELNDIKTTSAYTYVNGTKEEDYALQGSIYRWIFQDKITSDFIRIQHIFTDWQRMQAKTNPDYPQSRVVEKRIQLMSLEATERWITDRITQIMRNQGLEEYELPRCTDEELWKTDPVWKYYSDPVKAAEGGRATKNFPNRPAAYNYLATKQGKGVIIEVPGKVKACSYCPVFAICTQKDEYNHD